MKKSFLLIIPLLILTNLSSYSQEKLRSSLTVPQVNALIDSLCNALTSHYIFPNKAITMSNYLKAQIKKGTYRSINNPNKLAYQLETDIRHINYDAHLHIVFEPSLYTPKELSPVEREKAYKEQLSAEKENNFDLRKVEVLPGNIGYFLFNGFTGFTKEAKPAFTGALTFLLNTNALIIDLRFNGGGSTINEFTSYFFKDKTHLYDQISTFSKDTLSLYTYPSSTNGLALLMPIYILTSKNTASAAEAFASSMQALKRAIIVGDTTEGASHFTGFFPIGKGFIAKIPFARPVNTATFKDWEGIGIIPNIAVPASKALQKAQEIIYDNLLSKAKTERERRAITWGINVLKVEDSLANPTATILSNYTGTYTGGIHFYIENGNLLCKNPERGGTDIFKLKAVSDHVFLLDENAQVEFVKDATGNYSAINMLWKDGNITQKTKL